MGTKLGNSAFSLGRDAQATISIGGGNAFAASGKVFTFFGSITSSAFTASMHFRGGHIKTREFLPLEWNQMLERTGGRAPQFVSRRDDSTPDNCEANRREGEEYLRAVLEESGDARVIGEDLGTVPDYVRPSLRSLGIAGFKIPQWEVYHGRVTPGAEYERLSVATYATHDHKPLRAMWEEAFEHRHIRHRTSRARSSKRSRRLPDSTADGESDRISNATFIPSSWRRFSNANRGSQS